MVSGLVAVGFSAMPLLNMLGVRVTIATPMTVRVALGGLLGTAGIVIVFWPELGSLAADAKLVRGALFTVLAVVTATAGSVVAARNAHRAVPVWQGLAFAMLYGAVFSLLLAVISRRPLAFDWSPSYAGSLLYLAVFGSVIAFGGYLTAGPHRCGARRLYRRDGADRSVADLVSLRRLRLARRDLARRRPFDRRQHRGAAPSVSRRWHADIWPGQSSSRGER